MDVLDKGFVTLIDSMGDDKAPVAAARVSFGGEVYNDERDDRLIKFLMKEGHHTPFESIIFKFHVKCPIFIARQFQRHRVSSFNEVSGRYTKSNLDFYTPEKFRVQTDKNYKYEDVADNVIVSITYKQFLNEAREVYLYLLKQGIAKEHARMVLPLSLYTEFYWTINFRSLMNFIKLRSGNHAQQEIQEYSKAIEIIIKKIIPKSYKAFKELL